MWFWKLVVWPDNPPPPFPRCLIVTFFVLRLSVTLRSSENNQALLNRVKRNLLHLCWSVWTWLVTKTFFFYKDDVLPQKNQTNKKETNLKWIYQTTVCCKLLMFGLQLVPGMNWIAGTSINNLANQMICNHTFLVTSNKIVSPFLCWASIISFSLCFSAST